MINGEPKSTPKNNFWPTNHVLCTCAFLTWIFDKSKNNNANVLIFNHLKELDVFYFVWKNLPKRTTAARVKAIQSFADVRATIVDSANIEWSNMGDFAWGPQNQKIQKF